MGQSHIQFDQRVNNLGRKHNALSRGYVTRMRPDGLIVARPHRKQSRISLKVVFRFLLAFLAFKGFLIASLGPDGYGDRVNKLENGTVVEKAGAFVMQMDPVSNLIAQQIGPILR
jgi:hypothetical protein